MIHLIVYMTKHTILCAIHITVYLLYSRHFLFQYIYILYLLTYYMHMHFPVYHYTFTRSSNSLDLHIQTCEYLLLIMYSVRSTSILRSQSSLSRSPFLDIFSLLYSIVFIILCIGLMLVLFLYSSVILCAHLYVIAVILIYHGDYIACSSYFRLSVYTWGIFLAYICRRLSLRLRFHVFWEAGRDILYFL